MIYLGKFFHFFFIDMLGPHERSGVIALLGGNVFFFIDVLGDP